MIYKFYFYVNDDNADYETPYEDKNIKIEQVNFEDDSSAIFYAAETVADMRDEVADFEDSSDAEIYLDDISYDDPEGFCFGIERSDGSYAYNDADIIAQFTDSENIVEDLDEPKLITYPAKDKRTAHVYVCENCDYEIYMDDKDYKGFCPMCESRHFKPFAGINESIVDYEKAEKFFEDNIDNDNEKTWEYLSKRYNYVDDVADIPDNVEGQKILYRFSGGRNFNIDVYSDAYKEHIYVKLPKNLSEAIDIDGNNVIFRNDNITVYPGNNSLPGNEYVKISVEHPSLGKFIASVGKVKNKFKFDVRTDGLPWRNIPALTPEQKDFVDKHREIFKYMFDRKTAEKIDLDEGVVNEDTVKQGNYWVNKGKEGTHGKFRTKKAADAQRKAMFAQGFRESLTEDFDYDIDEESILTDIDNLRDEGNAILKSLSANESYEPLKEAFNTDSLEKEAGEFGYIIALIAENPVTFDVSDIKIIEKNFDVENPYIRIEVTEEPDVNDITDYDKIKEWEDTYIGGDSSSNILKGAENEVFNYQVESPKQFFIDTIEEDDLGTEYRIQRESADISGRLYVVVDSYIPADTSSWPGHPEEYDDHIENKDFKITYQYKITRID